MQWTREAGRLWDEIAMNLGGCRTVRFKSNLSQRAVRERFNLIQGRMKKQNWLHLESLYQNKTSLMYFLRISQREKEMVLQKLVKRKVRRRLQLRISETKL